MPSVVYSGSFDWNGVASVGVTITDDTPGEYVWTYHLTNVSFAEGIATFALPVEGPGVMISSFGSSVGWVGSVGPIMGNPDLVGWYAGHENPDEGPGPILGAGDSADFWFTTAPRDYALTNGVITDLNQTSLPGGFLAVPLEEPPALPVAPMPTTVLVASALDPDDPTTELLSLRSAIIWVNAEAVSQPNQQFTVKFTPGMATETIALGDKKQLAIKANVFINGADRNVTVTRNAAEGDFRLIYGDETSTIEIVGMTFTNGGGTTFNGDNDTGGAIRADGTLTLRDCTITDSRAYQGGGVYCTGALVIEGCTFENDRATRGGGIYAKGNLTIRNFAGPGNPITTSISNNKAVSSGAGIYALAGTLVIEDAYISLNDVGSPVLAGQGLGGGVFIGNGVTEAQILRAVITDNQSDGMGGGVYISSGVVTTVTFDQCQIDWNKASSRGAGLAIMRGTVNITSSLISDNWAVGLAGYGGGVYVGGASVVTFTNSTLSYNYAVVSGGGIWIDAPEADVTVVVILDNTWVVENSAANSGGGIGVAWAESGGTLQLTLRNGTWVAYNSLSDSGAVGGGLYLGYGTLGLAGVTFESNTASEDATGLYTETGTQVNGLPDGATFVDDTWFIG